MTRERELLDEAKGYKRELDVSNATRLRFTFLISA
jgi:hypothetical protein